MDTTPIDVSIVLVSWNTRQLLLDCLEALPAALGNLRADVWVVDNGSSDGSVAAVQHAYPGVRLIPNLENRGFAAANNQAIRASTGRYVLLLNSDTIPQPGSIAALARFLDQQHTAGIVGARLLNADRSLQPSWAAFPRTWAEIIGKQRRTRRRYATNNDTIAYSVDWVGGACLLIRRTTIEQIGVLDERFFMYCEEMDWCLRAKRRGWQICYLPTACVIHLGGQSSRQASTRMKAELYRSKALFFAKHYGHRRAWLFIMLVRCLLLGKASAGRLLQWCSFKRSRRGDSWYHDSRLLMHSLNQQLQQRRAHVSTR
jgi:GT2 family glycosyltransferase